MQVRSDRRRGGPIFVREGGQTVSLVPEVAVWELRLPGVTGPVVRVLRPHSVYVIDGGGVKRLGIDDRGRRRPFLTLALWALGPLQYWLFTRRNRHHGRKQS